MNPTWTTLISPEDLQSLLASNQDCVLLDCSFDLADTGAGRRSHAAGHLPGARYAHLDDDLAGPRNGHNGRHPLPPRETFAATVGRWGIGPATQVVTYDGQGSPYAARAWWMLGWLGHRAVAVLDGGSVAWQRAGGALQTGPAPSADRGPYPLQAATLPTIDADALQRQLGRLRIVDARGAERYRGDVEPLDPVGGHIPGASNRFFKDNLLPDGRFKSADELRAAFDAWGDPAERIVHQCGSGVTACHNLLAMTHAGLPGSLLYPGSWSEWCADPARPVARG